MPRSPDFEGLSLQNLARGAQRVAGPDGLEPFQLVEPRGAQAVFGVEGPRHQEEAEGERDGVDAACDEPPVGGRLRRLGIDVEDLRVEVHGKVDDLTLRHRHPRRLEAVADLEVIEIQRAHPFVLLLPRASFLDPRTFPRVLKSRVRPGFFSYTIPPGIKSTLSSHKNPPL